MAQRYQVHGSAFECAPAPAVTTATPRQRQVGDGEDEVRDPLDASIRRR